MILVTARSESLITWIESLEAHSRATCRFSNQQNSSWWSISKPQTDRSHNSAERAGESGSGDQVKAGNHRWRKIFYIALSAMLFAFCSSTEAQDRKSTRLN